MEVMAETVGASLVPVMVMTTSWVAALSSLLPLAGSTPELSVSVMR